MLGNQRQPVYALCYVAAFRYQSRRVAVAATCTVKYALYVYNNINNIQISLTPTVACWPNYQDVTVAIQSLRVPLSLSGNGSGQVVHQGIFYLLTYLFNYAAIRHQQAEEMSQILSLVDSMTVSYRQRQ